MLGQVDNFRPCQPTLVPIRLIQVDGHELIADFRSEFTVVHLTKGRHSSQRFELIAPLLELLFVIVLSVVLFALMFGPLLPSVLVETVAEHEDELHDLFVVPFIDHLGAVSQIQHEDLVGSQHVTLGL